MMKETYTVKGIQENRHQSINFYNFFITPNTMKMNCQLANKINLILYLKKLGFIPVKSIKSSVWFLSPFRAEKTPSFKIDSDKNIWYDFGEGFGGTVVDFVSRYNNCSIKKALEILDFNNFSFHQQKEKKAVPKKLNYSIKKVTELSSSNLIDYLKFRKINIEFAKHFLFQVHYSFDSNKEYYGIGFMNDFGGWEIRNKSFKGCLGKKEITSINNNSNVVSIFESWSDFLSYLTLKKEMCEENFIIINSTSLVKKIIDLFEDYTVIKLFFDNDDAGNRATTFVIENVKGKIIDNRIHYKNYNDLNDYLINQN